MPIQSPRGQPPCCGAIRSCRCWSRPTTGSNTAAWSGPWSSCRRPGRARSASSPTRSLNPRVADTDTNRASTMVERSSDRWVSFFLSVLLHGGLAAALVYGFWTYRQSRPPTPTLAIEATVVDSKSVSSALRNTPPMPQPPAPPPTPAPQPEPAPVPAPEEPTGPPEPTPEELAQREQAQKEQAEKEQELREQAEKDQAAAAEKQRQVDEQKKQEQAQREADLERQRKQEQ